MTVHLRHARSEGLTVCGVTLIRHLWTGRVAVASCSRCRLRRYWAAKATDSQHPAARRRETQPRMPSVYRGAGREKREAMIRCAACTSLVWASERADHECVRVDPRMRRDVA